MQFMGEYTPCRRNGCGNERKPPVGQTPILRRQPIRNVPPINNQ